MRKRITFAIAIGALAIPAAAMADTSVTMFDGFSLSNVNPSYDVGFVADGIQGQSLRMSNAVTSGSFGDWVFSNHVNDPAGESVANHKFVGEFKFKSVTGAYQPKLQISTSPDNGQGARMSFLRLADMKDGIHVLFA